MARALHVALSLFRNVLREPTRHGQQEMRRTLGFYPRGSVTVFKPWLTRRPDENGYSRI